MAGRGKKLFKNKDNFFEEILNYFDSIYYEQDEEDSRPETATFYGFYRYMHDKTGCSYRTIRRCFDEYWTDIKKDFEEIRADLLVRGAAKGKYNPTIAIFALKNWCKWTDKQEVTQETKLAVSDNFLDALSDSAAEDWESDEDETTEDSSV